MTVRKFQRYFVGSRLVIDVDYGCPGLAYNETVIFFVIFYIFEITLKACFVQQQKEISVSTCGENMNNYNAIFNPLLFNPAYETKTKLICI